MVLFGLVEGLVSTFVGIIERIRALEAIGS